MPRRYNDRILIQRPSRSDDAAGQPVYSWSTDTTVLPWVALDRWAAVVPGSGGERTLNSKRQPQAAWSVSLPWDPDTADISAEMRVLFPDERIAIQLDNAHQTGRGRGLMIELTGWQDFDFDWTDAAYDPFPWPNIKPPDIELLLLESGDRLLLETGGGILLS